MQVTGVVLPNMKYVPWARAGCGKRCLQPGGSPSGPVPPRVEAVVKKGKGDALPLCWRAWAAAAKFIPAHLPYSVLPPYPGDGGFVMFEIDDWMWLNGFQVPS